MAGPPGTACDNALQRLAAKAGIAIPAADVCVESPPSWPSSPPGAARPSFLSWHWGRPRDGLRPAAARRTAHRRLVPADRPAQPATATVLDTLAQAGQAPRQAP